MWKNMWFPYTYFCICLISNLNRPHGSGQSKRPTGQSKRPTGQSKRPTGQSKRPTGQSKRPTGQVTGLIGSRRQEYLRPVCKLWQLRYSEYLWSGTTCQPVHEGLPTMPGAIGRRLRPCWGLRVGNFSTCSCEDCCHVVSPTYVYDIVPALYSYYHHFSQIVAWFFHI